MVELDEEGTPHGVASVPEEIYDAVAPVYKLYALCEVTVGGRKALEGRRGSFERRGNCELFTWEDASCGAMVAIRCWGPTSGWGRWRVLDGLPLPEGAVVEVYLT